MSRLQIEGAVAQARELSFEVLAALPAEFQIVDVSRIDPKRQGDAVSLRGLLSTVQTQGEVQYLGLHASRDDFHASIPIQPILEKAFLIYRLQGKPLPVTAGGPFRFYIPDHAACHTHEIDECANVKYVDRLELTLAPGFDNRPHDAAEHEALHQHESS